MKVFDSSAILAYLQYEPGGDRVAMALAQGPCSISTVNICEILTKLSDRAPLHEARLSVDELRLLHINFDAELASLAASLRAKTRSIGASLGDRACLALAQRTADSNPTTVYTAENAWTKVKWPFKVVVIRPARTRA